LGREKWKVEGEEGTGLLCGVKAEAESLGSVPSGGGLWRSWLKKVEKSSELGGKVLAREGCGWCMSPAIEVEI